MPDELVTIATYRFAPKADMARALLEQEGIEAFVADATLVTADWLLGGAVGHIKLQVPANQAAAAAELLQKHPHLLDAGRSDSDDDDEGPTKCLSCGAVMSDDSDVCPKCGWSYDDPAEADGNVAEDE